MDNHLKITYSSSIERLCEINSSFDAGILKVAYVGKNRNGSSISKEAFERSMKTIYNCPIVCNYNRERDEIGSHDVDVVMKDGAPQIINITQPVGVIPESANYWWENYDDESGTHEYLCVDALVWKRQEAYQKIKENVITDESMEIKVLDGHMDNGVYVIESFEFLAFCLLETAEPCYESASLEVFEACEFHKKYAQMIEEFKQCFSEVSTSLKVDIHSKDNSEGGENQLDQKMELLAKFGLTPEQLDFDIETMSVEDLEVELSKVANKNAGQFSLTGEQFREELVNALHAEKIETAWGETYRYIYCDYNSDSSEVYCYDMDDWKLYGFTYSMNGDNVVIDFNSKKRKKVSIIDFDEGEAEFSYKHIFEHVIEMSALSKETELTAQFEMQRTALEEKYNTASDTIKNMNRELDELRQFKSQKLADERSEQEGAVFAMFADLNGIEAFESLKQNCSELSIDELEEKCYALRGRNGTHTFSKQKHDKLTRLPVEKNGAAAFADEPYGGLFVEFPPNR